MADSLITGTADTIGRGLSTLTAATAALSGRDKPLHPRGVLTSGTLVRPGTTRPCGVSWLDERGTDPVLVRTSRAIGLPAPLPDVAGLAVRVPSGAGFADLLLASTGWNLLGRHVLVPAVRRRQPLTTLLPYRTAIGPVVIGARPTGSDTLRLSWARVGHRWNALGTLTLDAERADDTRISFDPVLNRPDGLEQYPWVALLRERSYALARASRQNRSYA
ncbi:MAG TPA: hypothetical protein VJ872_02915 [Nocardioides sp.]|nr:hypothetical protein [Nocardioides sp.]